MADESEYVLEVVDPLRVRLSDPAELRYWIRTLGVTEDQLRQAVIAAGPTADRIKSWLHG